MELNEIKKQAEEAVSEIEIDWERLESDPMHLRDFEYTLVRATRLLPDLETLHATISQGKSVIYDEQASPLTYEEREKYLSMIEQELYSGYQLKDLYDRFTLIRSITERVS
jgi:hypothetical protein